MGYRDDRMELAAEHIEPPAESCGQGPTDAAPLIAPKADKARPRRWMKRAAALATVVALAGCGLASEEASPENPSDYLGAGAGAGSFELCQRWNSHPELQQNLANTLADVAMSSLVRPSGFAPGAVVEVGCGDKTLATIALGETGAGPDSIPSQPVSASETEYDLSSVSKPLTSIGIFMLANEGKISLDQLVGNFLPQYLVGGKDEVTFRLLLQHRSGLHDPRYSTVQGPDPNTVMNNILNYRLVNAPGSPYDYSNFGFNVLYAAGSAAAGEPLSAYINAKLVQPLGMAHTGYPPPTANCAPTSPDEDQSVVLRCIPQDKLARYLGGESGHARWFSTADDMASLAKMLVAGGEANGHRFLTPEDMQLMTTPSDGLYATGAMINTDGRFGESISRKTFGHIGANGTGFFVDPEKGLWSVILTNGTYRAVAPDNKTAAFKLINDTLGSVSSTIPN